MPAEQIQQNDNMLSADQEALLAEGLRRVMSVLSGRHSVCMDKSILLAKVVECTDIEAWQAIAEHYQFQEWLALPLSASEAEVVGILRDRIRDLTFQRDHDVLTGLFNRRFFDMHYAIELERAKRTKTPLSVAMLDLDNFKLINDTYGHACGDDVLRKLGEHVTFSLRSYDIAARFGGEEFVIILPGVFGWWAKKQAERILRGFSKYRFNCGSGQSFSVTFSAGVSWVSEETGYFDAACLLKQADDALYESKRQGKNQVFVAAGNTKMPCAETLVQSDEKRFLFSALSARYE